jgi:hypothetical protein
MFVPRCPIPTAVTPPRGEAAAPTPTAAYDAMSNLFTGAVPTGIAPATLCAWVKDATGVRPTRATVLTPCDPRAKSTTAFVNFNTVEKLKIPQQTPYKLFCFFFFVVLLHLRFADSRRDRRPCCQVRRAAAATSLSAAAGADCRLERNSVSRLRRSARLEHVVMTHGTESFFFCFALSSCFKCFVPSGVCVCVHSSRSI